MNPFICSSDRTDAVREIFVGSYNRGSHKVLSQKELMKGFVPRSKFPHPAL